MKNITCIVLDKGKLKDGQKKMEIDDSKIEINIIFLNSNIIKFETCFDKKISYDVFVNAIEKKFNCKLLLIKTRKANKNGRKYEIK